ncbi:MAG: hypothetical protein WC816_09915 [Sphingomonas sp.]
MLALAWRYAVLGLGLIGSALAALTALGTVTQWPRFLALDWPIQLLFAIAIISGGVQWFLFQRRQFQHAVILFFVTMAAWCGAGFLHLRASGIDCIENSCTVVIKLASQA